MKHVVFRLVFACLPIVLMQVALCESVTKYSMYSNSTKVESEPLIAEESRGTNSFNYVQVLNHGDLDSSPSRYPVSDLQVASFNPRFAQGKVLIPRKKLLKKGKNQKSFQRRQFHPPQVPGPSGSVVESLQLPQLGGLLKDNRLKSIIVRQAVRPVAPHNNIKWRAAQLAKFIAADQARFPPGKGPNFKKNYNTLWGNITPEMLAVLLGLQPIPLQPPPIRILPIKPKRVAHNSLEWDSSGSPAVFVDYSNMNRVNYGYNLAHRKK